MSKRIKTFSFVALLALVVTACGTSSESTTTTTEAAPEPTVVTATTVVDIAVNADDFTTLVAAVQAADLVEALQGEGPYTVFAPTDEAFAEALDALGLTADELLADTETLTSILTYHVLGIEAPAEAVLGLDGEEVDTLNGATIEISIVDGSVVVNDANVTTADLFADNGVVHVIDKVLLPPSA